MTPVVIYWIAFSKYILGKILVMVQNGKMPKPQQPPLQVPNSPLTK